MDADSLITEAAPHLLRMHETHGWLTEGEAMALFMLARSIKSPSPVVVEIGSFVGKSSIVIAGGLDGRGTLYCVDPFDSTTQPLYTEVRDKLRISSLLGRFKANTWAYQNIVPVQAFSQVAAYDDSIPVDLDMIFIDGNHLYEGVSMDLRMWVDSIKSGGILAMHDHHEFDPGVMKAVTDYGIGEPQHGWTNTFQVDSLLVTYRTEAPWTIPGSSQ